MNINNSNKQTNSMIRRLIIECDKHNASIIRIELANDVPTALVEKNDGTPTLLFYKNNKWC